MRRDRVDGLNSNPWKTFRKITSPHAQGMIPHCFLPWTPLFRLLCLHLTDPTVPHLLQTSPLSSYCLKTLWLAGLYLSFWFPLRWIIKGASTSCIHSPHALPFNGATFEDTKYHTCATCIEVTKHDHKSKRLFVYQPKPRTSCLSNTVTCAAFRLITIPITLGSGILCPCLGFPLESQWDRPEFDLLCIAISRDQEQSLMDYRYLTFLSWV